MSDKIGFLNKEYTEKSLSEMNIEELVSLRNLVASNLGVASISAFKDHETAVAQTWKALQKYEDSDGEEAPKSKEKAKKEPKEKKPRPLAIVAQPQMLKRPVRRSFSSVKILKQPEGHEGRLHRWPNYWDGMLIVDAVETEGCVPWDIMNWSKFGLMEVVEPNDEEYAERRSAWYAKHGMEDPEIAKRRRAEEREAAKAEREAAKAAKAAAAAAAKAESEAAKAAAE